jgi:phosphoglycolate phosphatase
MSSILKNIKMKNKIKLLIFDWDGTIMNSEAKIVGCLKSMATVLKLPQRTDLELKNIIGLGLENAILTLFPTAEFDIKKAVEIYRSCYFSSEPTESDLFTNAKLTIKKLYESGYILTIATGKGERGLLRDLKNTNLEKYFLTYRTAEMTKNKPHPQMVDEILQELSFKPQQAIMIGDTTYDLQMAQNAKIISIGVSYGVHSTQDLQKYNPSSIIDNMIDLLKIFE